MFEITVSQRFTASHAILQMNGEMESQHTHDWKVELTVVGPELDAAGCVVDFALIQKYLRNSLTSWDGKVLNDLSIFLDVPPSTEYLAKCLFDQLEGALQEEGVTLKKVKIWETENCSAAFKK